MKSLLIAAAAALTLACGPAAHADPPPTDDQGRPLCRVLHSYIRVGQVSVPYYVWLPCPQQQEGK